jgi:hypothetical protein
MATAPVITGTSITGNSFVTVTFTSAGATNEVLYLERAIVGVSSLDWIQVRKISRGTATNVIDYTAAPADITYRYRLRATNSDGVSGQDISNTSDRLMVCQDYSSIGRMDTASNDNLMRFATSRSAARGRSTTMHKFAGRAFPAAEKAIQRSNVVDISWYVETYTEVELFAELMLGSDFWYRDNTGRSFHAACSDLQESDSQVLNGWTLTATITQIDRGVPN